MRRQEKWTIQHLAPNMGRRKGQIAQMGNSLLVKDKQKKHGRRGDNDTFLHTTEMDDGVNYNRINFQSVTEQSHLEDFLTTAEMAGKDFTAERQNISFVTNVGQGMRLTKDDMSKISKAQEEHKALLRIPRRPYWDVTTSKEELLLREKDSFTDWRRQLCALQEQDHIELTPYEKNLDFWRQLWRVIERSDVIVQIVDARNPLLFRCEDLETYIKEVDPRKTSMLLINKADYLTERQRCQWMEYLNKENITGVFFSAKMEKEAMEGQSDLETPSKVDEDSDEDIISEEESEEEDNDENSVMNNQQKEESDNRITDDTQTVPENTSSSDKNIDLPPVESLDINAPCEKETSVVKKSSETCTHLKQGEAQSCSSQPSSLSPNKGGEESPPIALIENCPNIVTSEELLDIFRKLAHPSASAQDKEVKTVGMVGYPNVGKSSTINAILQKKKLAVSATPGRTKHLQTLYVDDNLMLCDCPGLVFPSFIATKAHLVVNGILPIDELRDHISPTNLICDYIPRNVIEATYSIMIPRPSVDDDPNRLPTAEELLNAYGGMRGFMTQRGVPDGPRASRYLLKDFVKGKLLYCNPPPGISGPEFQDQDRVKSLEATRPASKVVPPQIKSVVDKEFFDKRQSKAGTRGIRGTSDFVRVDTLSQSGRDGAENVAGGDACSSMGSQMSLNSTIGGKPWKKHNNRNKKEKLRRLHRDLDI